jgi:CrcB protein
MARYWLAGAVQRVVANDFPLGTLSVNVIGSFFIGVLLPLCLERGVLSTEVRLLVGGGFLGGFTTMSTFTYETMALAGSGNILMASTNVGISVLTCLASTWLGMLVSRHL